jgi:hypothetical protein
MDFLFPVAAMLWSRLLLIHFVLFLLIHISAIYSQLSYVLCKEPYPDLHETVVRSFSHSQFHKKQV